MRDYYDALKDLLANAQVSDKIEEVARRRRRQNPS